MDTNESQRSRTNGTAVGLGVALFVAQNIISFLLFGAYATGILPIIECCIVANLWRTGRLSLAAVVIIGLICSVVFPMVGIWAYRTRYGI